MLMLSTSRSPVMSVAPVILTSAVADNVLPSNVRLASSSNAPDVPARTILLFVKSLTVNVEATTSPVPFGVNVMSPLVSVDVIALPLRSKLSTFKLSILFDASVIIALLAVSVPAT